MISFANPKNGPYGIRYLILESEEDVKSLPSYSTPGSTAIIPSLNKMYKFTGKEWVLVPGAGIGGGSSSEGSGIGVSVESTGLIFT